MPETPARIGPYRIIEALGSGGMGIVYRGEHTESGVAVAVKTVLVADKNRLSGIRREVHALARLRHPGIVRIVDEGVRDGLPWYAMELVQGQTLRGYATALNAEALPPRPGDTPRLPPTATRPWAETLEPDSTRPVTDLLPLPAAAAAARGRPSFDARRARPLLGVLRRLCAPLALMHGEGLVHRDLKPDNILVREDGRPVLVDFGLALPFAGELARDAIEGAGGAAGTMAYMAPEQLQGERVDARADLYSLGCILFELLAGQRPFEGLGAGPLQGEAPRLAERLEDVPAELDDLVARMLARRPQDRIRHAALVAAALESLGAEAAPEDAAPGLRAYLFRPRLAGRSEALHLLARELEEVQRGSGRILLVGGESGVGKTRLALEAAREAWRLRIPVITGECTAPATADAGPHSPPLAPLRPALESLAERCRNGGAVETALVLGHGGKLLAAYEPSLGLLPGVQEQPEPEKLPPEAARLRLFGALADAFSAVAPGAGRPAPVLWILDDLQWADELSLGFLRFLADLERMARWPVLVLGTYRAEEAGPELLELLACPAIRGIRLGRLDEGAVGSIVGDMLGVAPVPEILARHLHRHSEGNPFFVAEYLRTAVAERLLYCNEAGDWEVLAEGETAAAAAYEALPLPRSLQDLVGRRLASLSAGARGLLEAACVLGRESEESLLAAVAGTGGSARLEAAAELIARQVLEEPAPGRLRFMHDKLREVAYARLEGQRAVDLHRRAAAALDARFRERPDTPFAELGHHWEQAGEADRARGCYLAGARLARDRVALGDAERLYLAYLGLTEGDHREQAAVRNEFAQSTLAIAGRSEEARLQHEMALEAARRLGDRPEEAASLHGLADVAWRTGRHAEGQAFCRDALRLFEAIGDRAAQGETLRLAAVLHHEQDQPETARTLYQQALAIQREVRNPRGEAKILNNLGTLHRDQGRIEEARGFYEQALTLFRGEGDRRGEGLILSNVGLTWLDQGHPEVAGHHFEAVLEIARENGMQRLEQNCLCNLALALLGRGRPLEAEGPLQASLAIARRTADRWSEGVILGNLAGLRQDLGRTEEADAIMQQAVHCHRAVGFRRGEGVDLGRLAGIRLALGRLEDALELCEQALAIHRQIGNRQGEAQTLATLAQIAARQGRRDEARGIGRRALSLLREVGDRPGEAAALQELAALAREAGDLAEARILVEQALVLFEEIGRPDLMAGCREERDLILRSASCLSQQDVPHPPEAFHEAAGELLEPR